jgi:O-antigen ligase
MYTEYASQINEEDLLYEQPERTSDIQLPPMIVTFGFAIWAAICLVGFVVIFLVREPVAGTVIIAVPTFIGMVIKPTFGLCILMLVLPTGAGIGYAEVFSLDRAVGFALAVAFVFNLLLSRPKLHLRNKALWVMGIYTVWILLVSLAGSYRGFELRHAFTQIQLLALIIIVYWILETNGIETYRWALRSYVIGTLGATVLAIMTGAAIRSIEETPQGRYTATLGQAIDANLLAALMSMAFLAAVYLLARDKNLFWKVIHVVAILFLPVMLLRIGSRGALVALLFTILSPLLFVRQVARRPAMLLLLLVVIVLACVSASLLIETGSLEESVVARLTDIGYAKQSLDVRMAPIKAAIDSALKRPMGTGYYGWFEFTGSPIWPHNDFFLALGAYGIPAGLLFVLIVIMIMFTIKRTPLGLEKLYTRAVLTFLLVMGMALAQLFHKYFWVFLAFVMAGERIAELHLAGRDLKDTEILDEDGSEQQELV